MWGSGVLLADSPSRAVLLRVPCPSVLLIPPVHPFWRRAVKQKALGMSALFGFWNLGIETLNRSDNQHAFSTLPPNICT